ncbi:MAG: MarR family transcriptional regulator [Firmicutes bacterium]|nr:MarR family transcriptional regulator [Bacillota bacterium]
MKNDKIKAVEQLFRELIPLYHKKLSIIFREDDEDAKIRCHKNQKRAILLIAQEKGVILSELGRFLDMRKGSLTSLIDSLEANGLVERRSDKNDRRKTLLYLTPAGEKYYRQLLAQSSKTYQQLFSRLSAEELDDFLRSLQVVVQGLRKI